MNTKLKSIVQSFINYLSSIVFHSQESIERASGKDVRPFAFIDELHSHYGISKSNIFSLYIIYLLLGSRDEYMFSEDIKWEFQNLDYSDATVLSLSLKLRVIVDWDIEKCRQNVTHSACKFAYKYVIWGTEQISKALKTSKTDTVIVIQFTCWNYVNIDDYDRNSTIETWPFWHLTFFGW